MNNRMRLKRALGGLLAVVILFGMTGCGKPSGMSDSNYQACKQIVEVYDAYLDFKIDAKAAGDKIAKIAESMNDESTVIGAYYSQFGASIGTGMQIYDDPVKALEDRNKLAEGVGLPSR